MYDCEGFVFPEHVIELAAIPDVADLQRTPFDEFGMTIREIVIHDRCETFA
jgi:hypothetical protein